MGDRLGIGVLRWQLVPLLSSCRGVRGLAVRARNDRSRRLPKQQRRPHGEYLTVLDVLSAMDRLTSLWIVICGLQASFRTQARQESKHCKSSWRYGEPE